VDSTVPSGAGDALITLLRSWLDDEGPGTFGHLILYTSFGVVRGRTGLTFSQHLAERNPSIIELNDVTVEHYSNHLPTATFDRLYVRLQEIHGFSLTGPPGASS
jgi:hypothetical protein